MSRSDDIVGYTYQADLYCPGCTVVAVVGRPGIGHGVPTSIPVEEALDWFAHVRGINRDDESSFDSGEFPKVVFRDMLSTFYCGCSICESGRDCAARLAWQPDRCGACGEEL